MKKKREKELREKIKSFWGDALADGFSVMGGNYERAKRLEEEVIDNLIDLICKERTK